MHQPRNSKAQNPKPRALDPKSPGPSILKPLGIQFWTRKHLLFLQQFADKRQPLADKRKHFTDKRQQFADKRRKTAPTTRGQAPTIRGQAPTTRVQAPPRTFVPGEGPGGVPLAGQPHIGVKREGKYFHHVMGSIQWVGGSIPEQGALLVNA